MMELNLFSSFDPSCSYSSSFLVNNWIIFLFYLLVFPMKYWVSMNQIEFLLNKLIKYLFGEWQPMSKIKGFYLIVFGMFIMWMMMNFFGLLPYVFVPSSHLSVTFPLALSFWLGFILFGLVKNTKLVMAHLVPTGSPYILMPLLVVLETISQLIRPLTLSVRLAINIFAGHLLLTLLGEIILNVSGLVGVSIVLLIQTLFLWLEFAVALIQSYVFTTLLILYVNEVI